MKIKPFQERIQEDGGDIGIYDIQGWGGGYIGADLLPQKVKTMTTTGAQPLPT